MDHFSTADHNRIAGGATAADKSGALTRDQLSLCLQRNWFRLLAPVPCGGAGMTLPDVVRLQEAIARADGNTSWVVTLCAGASLFGGFLQPDLAQAVFATENLCIAGSGAPTGKAQWHGEHYQITGNWRYATGADIATHFTFNAVIYEKGEQKRDNLGEPVIQAFIVPAEAVTVIPDWQALGLRGTATHSFSIADLAIGSNNTFAIDPATATSDSPLYQFPFLPLSLATFAGNICGIADAFLTLAQGIIDSRIHPLKGCGLSAVSDIQKIILSARQNLDIERQQFYETLDQAWQLVCNGDADNVNMEAFRARVLSVVKCARQGVNDLYPLCGLHSASMESDINRVWRDFHTSTQHALLLP